MSDIEIEALSNEDARLYREVILSRKKEEAVLRRRQYEDKILQIKEKKSVRFSSLIDYTFYNFWF